MKVLAVGAGVIGTVYGAHLGAAGHAVDVLSHPPQTDEIAVRGLAARDVLDGSRAGTTARVVSSADADRYDLVLVAARSDQLARACGQLAPLAGSPAVFVLREQPRRPVRAVGPGGRRGASRAR